MSDDEASPSPRSFSKIAGYGTDFNPAKTALLLQKIWSLRTENPDFDLSELGEVPWNMLLELMVSNADEKPVSVADLSMIYDIPMSTATRYVDYLHGIGLIDKQENRQNTARIKLTLTEFGRDMLSQTLARIADQLNIAMR